MKRGKRLFALILALLSTFAFTACGSADAETPDADTPDPQQVQPDTQSTAEPDGEVTILTYAKLSWDGPDRAAVDLFNKTHSDVQIEVVNYFPDRGEDISAAIQGRQRLLTEITSGKVPDIMELGYDVSASGGFLPYRQLARKGYLEDLWPWIENDPELGRDALMEAPLKAAEVDGGLYMAFDLVDIKTLVGAESVVGDRFSWTLDDLKEAFAAMPDDSTVLPFYTRRWWAAYILQMNLDSYIDWEAGTCSFDSPSFRSALEFLREFPEEGPSEWDEGEVYDRQMSGRQMLHQDILSVQYVEYLNYMFGGSCSYVGYPVEDGSVGSAFYPDASGRQMLMSSTCKNKEAAWEFVRQAFLPHQRKDPQNPNELPFLFGLPVNRTDYEYALDYMREEDRGHFIYGFGYYDVEVPPLTEEQVQRFDDLYNSIDKFILSDLEVYDIVMDAAAPYFAGAQGLDETIRNIENRVNLYVGENM